MREATSVKYFPTRDAADAEGMDFCQRLGRGYSPRYRVFKTLSGGWAVEMACADSCD